MFTDYIIKDISLADFGDKEIELAKNEMPGLVALLDEYKDQIPAEIKTQIQEKVDVVKKAIETNNTEQIKSAHDELNTHMQKIGEVMQQAQAAGAAGPDMAGAQQAAGAGSSKKSAENIEDAEVEIIDEDDKK